MFDQVKKVQKELDKAIVTTTTELETFRIKFISKKSLITGLFKLFKTVPSDQKKLLEKPLMN